MRHANIICRTIFMASALAATTLASPIVKAQAPSVQVRVYDHDHRDYHDWNDREDRAYRHYLHEQHKEYQEYHKMHHKVQKQYWNWRHEHPDHD